MRRFLIMIISLVLLVSVSGVIIWQLFKEPTTTPALSEELLKHTVETEEVTTNLAERGLILLQFQLQVNSAQTKDELELRMPQIKHLIIRTVSDKTLSDLRGSEGIAALEKSLQTELNQLLNTGQVIKVYTTKILAQN